MSASPCGTHAQMLGSIPVEMYPNMWNMPAPGAASQQPPCPNSDQDGGTWQNPEENKKKGSSENAGPFSHPVYKQISMRNGEINRMTKEQLKEKLGQLKLDTRGVKEVLKKRLKNFYKKQKLLKAQIRPSNGGEPHCDYLLVIDFEATCQENNPTDFKYEIIEFPIILIDTRRKGVVDEFHSYVKPLLNPDLTNFCKDLTHITQSQVDAAATFPIVYQRVLQWMDKHQLGTKYKFAVVTDGPWDMARFMHKQCRISGIPFPRWARKWLNVRKAFSNFYGFRRAKLTSMLENMGMSFEGHQHSGLDDSRNIARIVLRMINDGYDLKVNERIYAHKLTVSDIVADPVVESVLLTEDQGAASSDEEGPSKNGHLEEGDEEKENLTEEDWMGGPSEVGSDGARPPTGKFWSQQSVDSTLSEDSDVSTVAALQQLRLEDHSPGAAATPQHHSDDDGMSDLLAYYALQSSRRTGTQARSSDII